MFHGAFSDMIWLQRDLGLYVVGLFDTYHATNVLGQSTHASSPSTMLTRFTASPGFAQHSLASLLAMYTDFEPDKRYQLADWRIRYAKSPGHCELGAN